MPIPLTPFEESDRTEWTPLGEGEDAWIDDMLSGSDGRVTQTIAGYSAASTPMYLYTIGTGSRHVFWLAQQHGNEPAPREVAFTFLREWAETTDNDVLDYLSKVTLHIMPTGHPDSLAVRANPAGQDTNRHFVTLAAPESRVFASIVRDYNPDIVYDMHEIPGNGSYRFWTSEAWNPNTHPGIKSLAEAQEAAVWAKMIDAGYPTVDYPLYNQGPEYFTRGPVGLGGSIPLLFESPGMQPPAVRHDMYLVAVDAAWRWHSQHITEVADMVTTARIWQARPRASMELVSLDGNSGPIVAPVPRGYIIDASEWEQLQQHQDIYQIEGRNDGSKVFVSTRQRQQSMIVYMMDPASPTRLVAGRPAGGVSPPAKIPVGKYRLRFNYQGELFDAMLPSSND